MQKTRQDFPAGFFIDARLQLHATICAITLTQLKFLLSGYCTLACRRT
jgi:hypothetical protein